MALTPRQGELVTEALCQIVARFADDDRVIGKLALLHDALVIELHALNEQTNFSPSLRDAPSISG